MAKAKKQTLTQEELLAQALVPENEHPYTVPKNWVWTRLGDYIDYATDYVANGSFASLKANVNYYKDENYAIMVKTQDFSNNFSESLTYTDKHGYEFLKKSALYGGELILSNIGSVGKVFRVPYIDKPMTLASNSIMIKCHRESDYDLLYNFFLSPIGNELLLSITTGTAVLKFNKTDLKGIAFPLPPLAEQRRIVERIESLFEKLDRAKELAQSALDSFETRKAAILHKAFTGELTAHWREQNGVGMDSWEEKQLSKLCSSFQYGTSKKSEQSGEVVVVRMGNLQNGEIDWGDLAFTTDQDDIKKYRLSIGDVLFNRTNSPELVGKTSVYRGQMPAIFAGYLIRINYNRECLDGDYLNYVMNSQQAKKYCSEVKSDGVNQSNINAKKLAAFTIPYCGIEEQQEIVRILDSLFEKEQRARELCDVIDKIDLMKKAILARAFRGELGTNDPSEDSAMGLLKEVLA